MQIWTSIESPFILREIASRLDKLKKLSFVQLKELPEFSNDLIQLGESEITFTTYRELEKNGNLEIVVQTSMKETDGAIFKRKQVFADGFGISSEGEVNSLPKATLYFYM